ncbi:MAG: glycosyltransferase family 2 protein [bacterium]|nr:glycosyltransferase family 2 protein [bacterium]
MIYIIILNYNNYRDTILCLESVLKLNYQNFRIIVCDNASFDNSMEYIKKWANGYYSICEDNASIQSEIKENILPVSFKPIEYSFFEQKELKSLNFDLDNKLHIKLVLIKNSINCGFAAGNNVGIEYALKQNDLKYIWLLNNDTVLDKNSLTEIIKEYETNENIGLCGSTLLYYDNPNIVQVYGGGRYKPKIGSNYTNGENTTYSAKNAMRHKENIISDIRGASMLISKEFLLKVGLLNENYFLYMEEQDWAERGRKLGYNLSYAPESIVYHKEGSSIGCSNNKISAFGKYHFFLSRLIFTKTHYPQYLFNIYGRTILAIFYYLLKGKMNISKSIFSALKFFITTKRHEI